MYKVKGIGRNNNTKGFLGTKATSGRYGFTGFFKFLTQIENKCDLFETIEDAEKAIRIYKKQHTIKVTFSIEEA